MEPWVNQFVSKEQEIVLQTLARAAAKRNCWFLEVGSWCGDSALILGAVAKKMSGKLLCIDWWKGSDESDLSWFAKNNDIFSIFWERIKHAGLEDAVIPIRTTSETVVHFLKQKMFDLVYLDSDHRYDAVRNTLKSYSPLVLKGGIFCGHDCEGRINDFEKTFLEFGKNKDAYETVHCGTVLAVGRFFQNYSINHSIWSVRSKGVTDMWEPTSLEFVDIEDRRQAAVPPIGYSGKNVIYRYGKKVYVVPGHFPDVDIRNEAVRGHQEVVFAENLEGLFGKLKEPIRFLPVLIGSYQGYNLVRMGDKIVAVSQAAGPADLLTVDEEILKTWTEQGYFVLGASLVKIAQQILKISNAIKQNETNRV
ncbi:MAG: hypothetical protein A3G33_05280 [Omnitrophica bacterium RIFCSPLOWO2_12_FULL_44_17]|uniref:Class I SAM-dependent methyltransferase n=1 Tax=Candidatus Danuiimicrobium aquiferis TaxID=1801832 RepID=A0A1G1KQ78_9BACT|nr:MAG: hypothetical protein A3B72_04985 [Omnitrophica bacterium RIFCSPHIGHO2_02_FULL_45_28]OGW92385.1 MAG: hypothetical protein A3E74_08740 [Omnitrophica bacterium RIFCSPHIGHO2_12_FULL_44_12]OGW95046.1 MAG: hypothetical protein A3G33_05280 [Omnitrophica bacterium RIFCSPLOWO2_12_FULL_44_17]OGX02966.1 MAG: hypothetical protein A3J12_01505 [Omnitrophica bacterium RIFCSPLOWO2_02_FULL_44_11]